MSPYDKEPIACEGCEKLQQELNSMEEALDRERRYSDGLRAEVERLREDRDNLISAVETWHTEVERLRADAERYRWLRDGEKPYLLTYAFCGDRDEVVTGDDLDAAIDSARGES